MKRNLYWSFWVIPFIIIFLLCPMALAAKFHHRPHDQTLIPSWWEHSPIMNKLQLTEEQISTNKEIYKAHASKVNSLRTGYEHAYNQLQSALLQDQLDDEKVNRQLDALGTALSSLMHEEAAMHYDMMKDMSPEQRKILVSWIEQQNHQQPPKAKKKKSGEKRYNRF